MSDDALEGLMKMSDDELRALGGKNADEIAGSIRNVNIGFDGNKLGDYNCTNCVISTDLRLQGTASTAMPLPLRVDPITLKPIQYVDEAVSIAFLEKYFGTKWIKTSINVLNELALGKRGIVYGFHKTGQYGHVFNVVNQNGVIRFLDGQTGKIVNIDDWTNLQYLPTN